MRKSVFLILVLILLHNTILALETDTHKALNSAVSNIATPEGFKLDGYLRKNLGMAQGINEIVSNNLRLWEWFRDGGEYEDVPARYLSYVRSVNHFHEPLSNKGLKGVAYSSLQWALMPKGTQNVGGYYSWFDARDYFYGALTGGNPTTRNDYYGKTFRALGQIAHLVQDLSVPSHVRDDAHVLTFPYAGNYQYYEKWVKANANIRSLTANPIFFDLKILSKPNPLGSVPVANLFDTNTFTGADPNVSTRKDLGLSEFTNPNYLSDDTIFTDNFLYPSKKWLELWTDNSVGRKYLRKMYEGEPVNHLAAVSWLYAYRLRYFPQGDQYLPVGLDPECHGEYASKLIPYAVGYSAGLLNYFFRGDIRLSYETSGTPGYVIVNYTGEKMEGDFVIFYDKVGGERTPLWAGRGTLRDTQGDKTNTFDFIPPSDAKEPGKYILVFKGKMGNEDGAVAGYVFQRTLEITPPDENVYSIVDANQTDPYFTSIKAKVKNASPSEALQNGVIQAVAKYKTNIDDAEFIYSVSASRSLSSLAAKQATEVQFDFSNDPIPVDVTDLYLQVIFKGTIGGENNAVAIVLKDISEPTPIDISSDTDRICLYGSFYAAGSQEAINQVDSNHDGIPEWDIYAHDLSDIYFKISSASDLKYASQTDYNFIIPSLNPGDFTRAFYILTDYNFAYSSYETWINRDPRDPWVLQSTTPAFYSGTAIKNQTDYVEDASVCAPLSAPCYISWYPTFLSYRGREEWGGAGIMFINNAYPQGTECSCYRGILKTCPK
jgi:hypothetical protein